MNFTSLVIFMSAISCIHADPVWIWSTPNAAAREQVTFVKKFALDGDMASARLHFTCDNGATAWINGKQAAVNLD